MSHMVAAASASAAADTEVIMEAADAPFRRLPYGPPPEVQASLVCRPTDVFVCSWPKSGTTWMEAIVANLVVGQNFGHVWDVTPFFDIAPSWEGAEPAPELRARFEANGRRGWQ